MNATPNKIIVSFVLIILFVGAGAFLLTRKNAPSNDNIVQTPTPTPAAPALVDKTLVEEKTYKEPDTYAVFKVSYPQFKNASSTFNREIKDLVNDGIADHKKTSAENWKARYETRGPGDDITQFPKADEKFSFDTSYKLFQVNGNFISTLLTVSGYSGGAHGYEVLTSFNYNVSKKSEVKLEDLFPNDENYLKTISEFSRKALIKDLRKRMEIETADDEKVFTNSILPTLNEGTEPDLDNFSVFTFTPDAITFYFNEYQIGPYALGTSTVVMPRK